MPETQGLRFRMPPALRWALTAFVLIILVWVLDTERLIEELSRFSVMAVGMALLVSIAQVALSAWRWRFTARCLGLELPMRAAVREYYLATFLNQCLPGGVLGDVNRALRHGSGSDQRAAALHGVMIERLSGQLAMFVVALCAGVWLAANHPQFRLPDHQWGNGMGGGLLLAFAAVTLALVFGRRLWRRLQNYLSALGRDIYRGLLSPRVFPLQIGSSLLVVASYLAVFWLLASSADDALTITGTLTLLALCSLLLLAMVIPLTVAGWGVREGAAAVLWPLAGLPAEQGVALSVGYGLAVLLSSLPGSLFVFSRPSGAG
ncbi:lysylphosphatidylglycerol synthase transmembrane domain-containing protein [Marinobacter confluentis]|uniref:Flippase-like domain-containing protein n=1 Tax=Marinobacter confluentis TaxID=1697557 RepID=A0A4Z1BTQ5_9GAMM|nr:lysylphosphatidylglycerol synthase transmembrane domain-containing protein [Marinobacter confluentis]TGN41495.1 flippase-like domain-containing protein [Marinobacter confluentis]